MMYDNKLAVAVKSNGKVLREFKDIVYLPFGSEYSFLIKNLNTKRAVVKIEIDGEDVTSGGVVVNANGSIDLERFIGTSLDKGHKFKFIERTASIENHRGVGVQDGLIRIEFEYEKFKVPVFNSIDWNKVVIKGSAGGPDPVSKTWLDNTTYDPRSINNDYYFAQTDAAFGTFASASAGGGLEMNCTPIASAASYTPPQNEAGITVEGSISDQRFVNVNIETDGVKHVMVMKFLGETENGVVQEPITVKHKAECKYCGKGNKHNAKFCGECGANLEIV